MSDVRDLIRDVAGARARFLTSVGEPTPEQAIFKPSPDSWSIIDNVEHITLAEQVGINGIWKALDGLRRGNPVWEGEPIHRRKPIETVIEATWKEKEQVPPVAAPRWGGPVAYWRVSLESCHSLLEALGEALNGEDLERIIYPHPISGPLDARQRLEFLRFHLDRHRAQVERIQCASGFPAGSAA